MDKSRDGFNVAIALLALFGIYFAFFHQASPRGPNGGPRLSGTGSSLPADYGWTLEDLDGKAVSFGRYRGRPVLLNIWATWCGPCRSEMPSLVRLAANPKLKGVAFVAVTNEKASPSVASFAATEMKGLTVLRADAAPGVFLTSGIPATFLIAPDGRVVASEVGSANWDDPAVVDFLAGLGKPAAP